MKFISILFVAVVLSACGTITRFDQTCLTCVNSQRIACKGSDCPSSFMVGTDCLVTIIETGENIFLNDILLAEKIQPRGGLQMTIAKINGRYFVIGEGFANMWILSPAKRNTAALKSVALPSRSMGIVSFELFYGQLKAISQNKSEEYIFDDIKDKWTNVKAAKVGE